MKERIFIIFSFTSLLMTGCLANINDKETAGLELTSVVLSEPTLKSIIDGDTLPLDANIGLSLFKDREAVRPYAESGYTNIRYSWDQNKKKWTGNPGMTVGSPDGYLYAYYPYDNKAGDIRKIPVASSFDGDDVMYAEPQEHPLTSTTAPQTKLVMRHALTSVAVSVKNDGYTGSAKISQIDFSGARTAISGMLDATDGKILDVQESDVSILVPEDRQQVQAGGSVYECLLVPSDTNAEKQDVDIKLTVDGVERSVSLTGDNGVVFAQGVKSTVIITLTDSGLFTTSVQTVDWKTVKVGGYRVTIQLAEEISGHDVIADAYVKDESVIIRATALSKKGLDCKLEGMANCMKTVQRGIFIFKLSQISSDLTATIKYAGPLDARKTLYDLCSFSGRAEGAEGNAQAREYIVQKIWDMGLEPKLQWFANINNDTIANILVHVSKGHDELVIAGAHYDGAVNAKNYPAANDNASGCTTMLMVLDSLGKTCPEKDIMICFWNGEEGVVSPTKKGSKHFVENFPDLRKIGYYVNCDVVGYSHDNDYTNVFYSDDALLGLIKGKVNGEGLDIHYTSMNDYLQNSDNETFYSAGVPTIAINDGSYPWMRYPIHSALDVPDSLSISRLNKMRDLVVSMLL